MSAWGVYGYQDGSGTVEVLLRTFPTEAQAIRFAEPLSTCIVSAEVREIKTEGQR